MYRSLLAFINMHGVVGEVTFAFANGINSWLIILCISLGVAVPNIFARRYIAKDRQRQLREELEKRRQRGKFIEWWKHRIASNVFSTGMKSNTHWHEMGHALAWNFCHKKVFKKRLFEKNKYICYRIGSLLLVRVIRIKRGIGWESRTVPLLWSSWLSWNYFCHWMRLERCCFSSHSGRLQDKSQSEDLPFIKVRFCSWVRRTEQKKKIWR